jgi:prepilin-type N-terminal cleavage/methylation domain-containing protein
MMKKNGFTLIEILVVIAILGILMGMTIPAASTIVKKAKRSTARTDAAVVQSALMQYRAEYNCWPGFAKGKNEKHLTDEEFLETMMPPADGKLPDENLKRLRFIEGGKDVIGPGNAGGKDKYIDPWGNPFQYLVNETPKETMGLGSFGSGYDGPKDIRAKVLVWSAGEDGDYETWEDNVWSWGD